MEISGDSWAGKNKFKKRHLRFWWEEQEALVLGGHPRSHCGKLVTLSRQERMTKRKHTITVEQNFLRKTGGVQKNGDATEQGSSIPATPTLGAQPFFLCGAVLCVAACLAASLPSTQ